MSVTVTVLIIDGFVQERCNSIADALELHLSWTKPLIWCAQLADKLLLTRSVMVWQPVSFLDKASVSFVALTKTYGYLKGIADRMEGGSVYTYDKVVYLNLELQI